ncbi:hypothetical protein EK904_003202 [Melospiza melodia maxima]|nr:hypothetical protein EK904_003202 [Melospiza melodia maxima]
MQLEDGRFLMSADRYDKLLQEHTKSELDAWKIVRVSEDFRVIALGLPVPKYSGNPLDPPLRSRFQARDVYHLPFKDSFPMMSVQHVIDRLYPYHLFLGKEGRTAVKDMLKRFELQDSEKHLFPRKITRVESVHGNKPFKADVTVQIGEKEVTFQVPAGTGMLKNHSRSDTFIRTSSHNQLLAEMMQSHMVKDMCLIGGKGCGKTVIAKEFADILGYSIEPIMLYQDMTARDLLQQRYTLPNGDTAWRPSPLVTAALEGKLVLLDGIHRINPGTLAVLQRLIHDRELTLYDGTRLLREDRYQNVKEELQLSDEKLQERSIFPIHPSFRIVVLAEPPVIGSTTQQWLSPEFLTLFLFHNVRSLSKSEEIEVIKQMAQSLASFLSTRQLLRICRRLSQHPDESLYDAVNKACLSR